MCPARTVNLPSRVLKREVQGWFTTHGDHLSIIDVTLGYELRCAPAIPFDIDYTRTLGYGAVRFLCSEPSDERLRHAGLICVQGGHISVLPFDELHDPSSGRVQVRTVDVRGEHYHVARKYMIRLEPHDLQDPEMQAKLATAGHMTPSEFETTFTSAVTLAAEEIEAFGR